MPPNRYPQLSRILILHNLINLVVRANAVDDLDSDVGADWGFFDLFVLDLHGVDLLREVGRHGVRVVCVTPGWIATESNRPNEADEKWLASNVSLGRAGTREEVAEVIWFLAGEAASYITGQSIIVDGGMT